MKPKLQTGVLSYLRFWARKALQKHNPVIIGIAGSVGKSSTRNAVEAILRDYFPTKSVGNSETGIPLGILEMKPENYSKLDWAKMLLKAPQNLNFLKSTKYLIAEMGIDEPDAPKNMEYLLTILKPTIAVSLNVSATHSQQFDKTLQLRSKQINEEERLQLVIQNIAEEDTKIITQSGAECGIYNAEDKFISQIITKKTPTSTKLLSFGEKSSHDISYGSYKVSLKGTSFELYVKTHEQRIAITLHFPRHIFPREYREVFAAAILVSLQTGLNLEQIKASLEKNYQPPKSRSSLFAGINQTTIIDSTYNASKASITTFLDLVDTLKKETDRKIVFLFGDMRELGQESQIEHEAIANKLIGIVDYLYLVGPQTREFVLPIIQTNEKHFSEIRWFDSATRAGEFMQENLPKNAIVLAKGSQNTIFLEEAVKRILQNKEDAKNLCRQDEFWQKVKRVGG
ncbi:MAG TPA: Mur ligase family protein [Patescibacteria group bacterium]|nr:Mur ligase family protein [Patescibacteria group bacterium]